MGNIDLSNVPIGTTVLSRGGRRGVLISLKHHVVYPYLIDYGFHGGPISVTKYGGVWRDGLASTHDVVEVSTKFLYNKRYTPRDRSNKS